MPLPYSGHRLERRERIGERWTERADANKAPGARQEGAERRHYHYNELGYRGPGFYREARWFAFVFGESDAFGDGVDFEEVWAVRVAREIAARRGFARHETCVMNFAEEGASNAHIARTAVTQCGRIRPDLVLVNFAEEHRTEGWMDGRIYGAGWWHNATGADRTVDALPEEGGLRSRYREWLTRARAFLKFAHGEQAVFDALRDILLVQEALRASGIESYAVSRGSKHLFERERAEDPAMGPLVRWIDRTFLPGIDPLRARRRIDWTEKGQHYGARTHEAIARKMVEHIERVSPSPARPAALAMAR
ncbi:MAG: hypothetical protein AAF957_04215 [Planctomycetota bacterium]